MELGAPLHTRATDDKFLILGETTSYQVPNQLMPKELHNDGNFIISLSQLSRFLAEQAESLGVEIYPGFAADEVLFNEDRTCVRGVSKF